MTSTMTRDEAQSLRAAHDMDAELLSRKPKYELVAIYQSEGGYGGGTWSKDDLVGSILGIRFPLARLNETTHVLYHKPGEVGSTACDLCVCQATHVNAAGFLEQCKGGPRHDGMHEDRNGEIF